MIAARSERSDITDILLEGEHIDLDIQENVRIQTQVELYMTSWWLAVCGDDIDLLNIRQVMYNPADESYLCYFHILGSLACSHSCVGVCLPPSSQSTGWSALFFSAERGGVATTQSLLTAGANIHLKDKVDVTLSYNLLSSHRLTLPSYIEWFVSSGGCKNQGR